MVLYITKGLQSYKKFFYSLFVDVNLCRDKHILID